MDKSMIFTGLLLAILVLFSAMSLHAANQNYYEYPEQPKINVHPENTSPLYVYGGYGYYGWKMISTSDYLSLFTGKKSSGMGYSHDAEPFVVKRYGVKSNISIFSIGLDYLSDTLEFPTQYNSRDHLDKTEDRRAQQLKFLSGLRFGDYMLHGNVTRREFSSTITSNGLRDFGGTILPLPYYPKSGDKQDLDTGDKISWYTRYTQYEVKLEIMYDWGFIDLGIKATQYEAPSEVNIRLGPPTIASGDVLMYTDNRMSTMFIGFSFLSRIAGDLYLKTYTPMDISLGGYRARCDYFEAGSLNPFSFNSLSLSSAGNISLQYLRSHVKLEAGVDYGLYYSSISVSDIKMKKELEVWDSYNRNFVPVSAGEKVDLDITRIEFLWGLYISACLYI